MGLAVAVAVGLLLVMAGSAIAAGGTKLCIPTAANTAIVTPTAGACKTGFTLTELGAEGKEGKTGKEGKEGKEGTFAGLTTADKETLLSVLPYVKFVKEGVDKKPTVQISGANLQVINGTGSESTLDGLGNFVLGYDEKPGAQTGSHNGKEASVSGGYQDTVARSRKSAASGGTNWLDCPPGPAGCLGR